MNILDYLFYRVYKFQEYVGNTNPVLETIIGISALMIFNIISLLSFCIIFFEVHILSIKQSTTPGAFLMLFIFCLNLIYFLNKKRHKKILEHFKNEEKRTVRNGNLLVLFIILFTLSMIYLSLYFAYKLYN